MAGLADWLEDYRNWRGRQEWEQGKGWQDFFGGDPRAQEQFEKLSGFSTDAGGLVGMIKASHGSPHAFTKFDFSKIGTGEGAQAYGHGGYFAQGFDSPVAQEYQKQLAEDVFDVAGNVFDPASLEHLNVRSIARRGDLEGAINKAKEIALSDSPVADMAKSDLSTLLDIQNKGGLNPAKGHLYNVELRWPDAVREAADPLGEHHLLDWDAPISEQPSIIQDKFHTLKPHNVNLTISGDPYTNLEVKGHDVYNYLSDVYSDPKKASALLKSLGIPGIRYLDQASRGAGEGTRNYVMFDDALANIVSRNGVSLSDLLRR